MPIGRLPCGWLVGVAHSGGLVLASALAGRGAFIAQEQFAHALCICEGLSNVRGKDGGPKASSWVTKGLVLGEPGSQSTTSTCVAAGGS